MTSKIDQWTKLELQIYILLLCANADSEETDLEIEMITSKVDTDTFNKIYNEFKADTEDEQLEKIDDNIHQHEYTNMELAKFRQEAHHIFFSDGKFMQMEQNLNRILDNILY
ncbi:hypothetical protein [Psychroserpens ponticola]|uniref:TerB family tellurite resistance protein n=1 Tax=Psychroserpens ponticola TaxID=2932268 RepID=A0ABY7S003_9FLAO|nr:hypothetical protein [Psychroserpens ponticola]WCO02725.1 hypothetical protein MUN68_004320 [Psychroserpens ponticola]